MSQTFFSQAPLSTGQTSRTFSPPTAGGSPVTCLLLVFRDHPAWGRSSYLVLPAGDFDCYGSCTVKVTAGAAPPKPMAARRPKSDEAIARFIHDARAVWGLTRDAEQIRIEFPIKIGGTRTATFDVAGRDRAKMPGWDGAIVK